MTRDSVDSSPAVPRAHRAAFAALLGVQPRGSAQLCKDKQEGKVLDRQSWQFQSGWQPNDKWQRCCSGGREGNSKQREGEQWSCESAVLKEPRWAPCCNTSGLVGLLFDFRSVKFRYGCLDITKPMQRGGPLAWMDRAGGGQEEHLVENA